MQFFFLTKQFYEDYKNCSELEQKQDRPYIMVGVMINGLAFAVPLRSKINHKYVLWTDEANRCGVDFSKAIVITKREYIDRSRKPYIRPAEFECLRGKEYLIEQKMRQYIKTYKEARKRLNVPRCKTIYNFSALQYFDKYIK